MRGIFCRLVLLEILVRSLRGCFRLGLQLPIISKNTRCICAKAPLVGNMGQHLHTFPIGGERLEKLLVLFIKMPLM